MKYKVENNEFPQFQVGDKLTIFTISDWMAHTQKMEITITRTMAPEPKLHYQNGPIDGYRIGAFKARGKRKAFYLDIPLGALVFEGWDLPIRTDSETFEGMADFGVSFRGNACLNLGWKPTARREGHTDAGQLCAYINNWNLNPHFDDQHRASCIMVTEQDRNSETLLFPEIHTSHAVIQGMKAKAA